MQAVRAVKGRTCDTMLEKLNHMHGAWSVVSSGYTTRMRPEFMAHKHTHSWLVGGSTLSAHKSCLPAAQG